MTSEPYLTPQERRRQRAAERRITTVWAMDQITDTHRPPNECPPRAAAMHDHLADQLRAGQQKET